MQTQTSNVEEKPKKKYYDYGRVDWKLEFPESRDAIKAVDDETLIKWYRFLPPALGNYKKALLLSDIVYEVKKRFYNKN